jgi:hypothetical protein
MTFCGTKLTFRLTLDSRADKSIADAAGHVRDRRRMAKSRVTLKKEG